MGNSAIIARTVQKGDTLPNQVDIWPIERIRTLTKLEVQNLRCNALALGGQTVVERCDQVLNTETTSRSGRAGKARRSGMSIPETAAAEVAELIINLPKIADVQNAQARSKRLAHPATTFSVLWRQYVNCGFSSQEKSDPDTPLGRFAKGDSPLLHLQSVVDHGQDHEWIASELAAAGLNRMTAKKTKLILSAREAFVAAKGHDDLLVNGRAGTGLGAFLDLASGRANDHNIANSKEFSESIDVGQLYGIGHKQIRNILVNTGLAHNVIPIDSRWKEYVGHRMHFDATDLAQRTRYLEVEHVIRKALMLAQECRNDIPNLAVLDAAVFAVQSVEGHAGGGWTGS